MSQVKDSDCRVVMDLIARSSDATRIDPFRITYLGDHTARTKSFKRLEHARPVVDLERYDCPGSAICQQSRAPCTWQRDSSYKCFLYRLRVSCSNPKAAWRVASCQLGMLHAYQGCSF